MLSREIDLNGCAAHDERILGKGTSAVGAQLVQTAHACPHEVIIMNDEHERFLLHQEHRRSESYSTVKSVGGDYRVDKMVGQFGLPNGVKSLMRRSPQV